MLTVVFVLTGFTALTLQVVWQRVIALHGGVDLYATTTVVAAFLGGLGVGSLAGGSLADRLRPRGSVAAFAAANLGIAGFALASPWLFYDLYARVEPAISGLAVSFAFHVALLAVPTTLMGLSLPLLSRGLVRRDSEIASTVGRLYSANTLGAAAGAAVSGWFLLGTLGFLGTIRLAALGNLVAAVVAAVLAWRRRPDRSDAAPVPTPEPVAVPAGAGGRAGTIVPTVGERVWPWYVTYALTGAVALGLEVVFFRVVDTVMRSNSYTFAHVLSLYLVLFGVGTAVGSRLVRRVTRPDLWFGWLQAGAGAGALAGVLVLLGPLTQADVGGLRTFLESYFSTDGLASGFTIGRSRVIFATVVAPLLVMGVPVLCFGAAFPFVQAVANRRMDVLGRHTGRLLFANVAGNVAGTMLTGFVLLDRLGTSGTLRLLGLLLLVPGVIAALNASSRARRVVLTATSVAVVGTLVAVFPSNKGLWALVHNAPVAGLVVDEKRSCLDVLAKRGGNTDLLYINGASQNGYPYDDFHLLIGLLPSLLHPAPERGLAVGLGMGGTTYGMALDDRLDTVETVEICGGQIDLLEHLAERGDSPESEELLADERVELIAGDGRKHLLRADEGSLDVVVVDTLRPQSGYSGNLYSSEFYELVDSRLADDGLFTQWLPTGRTQETLQEVFPHLLVFDVPSYFGSRFAVASPSPIDFERSELTERLDEVDLGSLMPSLADAVTTYAEETEPTAVEGGQPVEDDRRNEDLFPRDEYWLNNGF